MNTRVAADFVRTAALADAPDAVGDHVRAGMLDTLAAATAGYRFRGGDVVRAFAADSQAPEGAGATLLDGSGEARSLPDATLSNATAANVLDADDGHRTVRRVARSATANSERKPGRSSNRPSEPASSRTSSTRSGARVRP